MPTETLVTDSQEHKESNDRPSTPLPLQYSLRWAYLASLLILLLTAVASVAALLFPDRVYPTAEARHAFLANDVVNLFIGLPILLISLWLSRREKLVGLLFWPGALFYGLYNYLVYLFGVPLTVLYPLYLLIVTLSIYTIIGLVAGIDAKAVKERLDGHVPHRLAGAILIGFGAAFALRVIWLMAAALVNQNSIAGPELGLLVADFIFSAALFIGGVLLWRRRALGYVGGTGLLFQASMLFVALIAVLFLQPLLSGAPLPLVDMIVVFAMGLICSIPFILFVRGVIKS
jgi:hypothetical protein